MMYAISALILIIVLVMVSLKASKYFTDAKEWRAKYEKELLFRKSSEIRLGKTAENMAPFIEDWPWDPRDFRFLGNPVDGIQFNDDDVVFVEIKTGKSRLSRSQKHFKHLINQGKVKFISFKITPDGCKLKEE